MESARRGDEDTAPDTISLGWGSPIGLSVFLVGLAACFLLVQLALSL